MMKKLILPFLIFLGIAGLCFAQNNPQSDVPSIENDSNLQSSDNENSSQNEESQTDETQGSVSDNPESLESFSDLFKDSTVDTSVTEVEEALQNKSFIHRMDFVFGLTPLLSFNTKTKDADGHFISSPFQINFPIYIGMNVPNYTYVSFQPSLKFYFNYSLLADVDGSGNYFVLPSDIESRTAQTWNFLLNLPITFKLNFFDKNSLNILGGVALLMRFATIPNGIDASEEGELGSVKSDVDYMNTWFWQNGRFFYVTAGANWLFYRGTLKFGPEFFMYFPVSVFTDKKFDAIVSAGFTIQL